MELGWGPRRRSPRLLGLGGGPDLISALPDDLLLLVLARLPCVGAAARTGVLSRRWRGLWARLRRIVFRDVPLPSLEAALGRVAPPPPAVSLLEIRVPEQDWRVPEHRADLARLNWLVLRSRLPKEHLADTARANSLLRAAARLEPEELVFALLSQYIDIGPVLDLPSFRRATSIVLDLCSICLRVPAGVEFPALETLSLSGRLPDLDPLLSCCPRLRTLRLHSVLFDKCHMRVNSPSLQELVVDHGKWTHRVNIVAPALKQLTMSFISLQVSISILAPMVEKVLWHCCSFTGLPIAFGCWRLDSLRLQTAERQGQLPSLHIHACTSSYILHGEAHTFTQEMEKHMIADVSVFELHLTTKGHVYGALTFHLLGMNRICSAMQRLNVVLQRTTVKEKCPFDCPCELPNWRSQTISLTALEEMEINGFDGDEHEIDFLKLIFQCAPMLKRMIVKLSHEASASNDGCTKIYNIFRTCSNMELSVYLSSGLMLGSQNFPST